MLYTLVDFLQEKEFDKKPRYRLTENTALSLRCNDDDRVPEFNIWGAGKATLRDSRRHIERINGWADTTRILEEGAQRSMRKTTLSLA